VKTDPTAITSTIAQLLHTGTRQLAAASDSPRLDVELVLTHVLKRPRSYLYSWPESRLTHQQQTQFQALLARRAEGEPLAYLTGKREFWSLELEVSAAVLIPRPETELLVQQALRYCPQSTALIADLGTGSGAIALALAQERPDWRVIASDYSASALAVARRNAARLDIHTVEFRCGDWFAALPADMFGCFDSIVSNPPYIATDSPYLQDGDVRFEPRQALSSGADGLDAIRLICTQAPRYLKPGGCLLLEHGYDQGAPVRALMADDYRAINTLTDLAGHERVTCGQRT